MNQEKDKEYDKLTEMAYIKHVWVHAKLEASVRKGRLSMTAFVEVMSLK